MRPEFAKKYLKEFIRILHPKGVLVFQLPSEPAKTPKGLLIRLLPFSLLTKLRENMEMHAIKKSEICAFFEKNNVTILDIQPNMHAGEGWVSYTYFVQKRG